MASGVDEPVGCMVGIAATFLDIACDYFENFWSFGLFGNVWETARCMGKVIRVTKGGTWCLVQWSIDGTVTRVPASALTQEAPPPPVQAMDSPHRSLLSSLLSSFA